METIPQHHKEVSLAKINLEQLRADYFSLKKVLSLPRIKQQEDSKKEPLANLQSHKLEGYSEGSKHLQHNQAQEEDYLEELKTTHSLQEASLVNRIILRRQLKVVGFLEELSNKNLLQEDSSADQLNSNQTQLEVDFLVRITNNNQQAVVFSGRRSRINSNSRTKDSVVGFQIRTIMHKEELEWGVSTLKIK